MKQVEVQIMGQSYLLGCPEGGEQRLLEAVERVDTAMCKIRDAGKVRARDRIAVLASLNLAFDLSDQVAVPAAAPEATAIAVEPTGAAASNSQEMKLTPDDEALLQALVRKLDETLNEDGQLL